MNKKREINLCLFDLVFILCLTSELLRRQKSIYLYYVAYSRFSEKLLFAVFNYSNSLIFTIFEIWSKDDSLAISSLDTMYQNILPKVCVKKGTH